MLCGGHARKGAAVSDLRRAPHAVRPHAVCAPLALHRRDAARAAGQQHQREPLFPGRDQPDPTLPRAQVARARYVSAAASTPSVAPARAQSVPLPDFTAGCRVRHKAFGDGMVVSVKPMGGDALLEIAFDQKGTKRLMAKSAAQFMQKI